MLSDSNADWPSTAGLALRPPPPARQSTLWRRAIWPVARMPSAASGPPKPGEPDFMSVFETNEPMIAGQPGRIAWTSAMPASDSAVCCASAAGTETGPIAPIMMNGVMFTI